MSCLRHYVVHAAVFITASGLALSAAEQCVGSPKVIDDNYLDDKYRGAYALVDYGDDLEYSQKSYWMGTGANQYFTIDYGCPVRMSYIVLRNSHHYITRNSGTKDFVIDVSKSSPDGPWFRILEKSLPDARSISLPPRLMGFTLATSFNRYLRFRCTSPWGSQCALHYLAVN